MTKAIRAAMFLLILIGLAAVVRRMVSLYRAEPPATSEMTGSDAAFSRHTVLTTLHILPGALFLLLGPLQFAAKLRARRPRLHRWIGRVFLVDSAVVGVTALLMSWQTAIGGANETAAATLFGCIFLVCLVKVYRAARRRDFAEHREWAIRCFTLGLAVAAIRPIVGIFFATRRLTHLSPSEFFGTAFWLGFVLMAAAAECWIGSTRLNRPFRG